MIAATPSTPLRRGARRVLAALGIVATVAVLGLWAVTLRPQSLGGPADYVVIHGNSMWPRYLDGDLIILRRQSTYRVGEVVAYHVPRGQTGQGLVVIHRIVAVTPAGFTLKGDNNPSTDPWHPTTADVVGAAWMQVPRMGRLLVFLHRPPVLGGLASLVVVGSVLWCDPRRTKVTPVP
jgi:signal peptidase I